MSLTGMLLRGFGPRTGGGETPPAEPALTIVGNGNGVDALATISGSTTGALNVVQVQAVLGDSWVNAGSRSGDGTVTLTLGRGCYWGRVKSTKGGLTSYSNLAYFAISSPETAPLCAGITSRAGTCPAVRYEVGTCSS